MTQLVIRSVNGRITFMKDHDPFKPSERPLTATVRRIELSAREEPLDINVLSTLFEFRMLDNQ